MAGNTEHLKAPPASIYLVAVALTVGCAKMKLVYQEEEVKSDFGVCVGLLSIKMDVNIEKSVDINILNVSDEHL